MDNLRHPENFLPCPTPDLKDLLKRLLDLRKGVMEAANSYTAYDRIHSVHRKSAFNLIQYLAIRARDIRPLQFELSEWGLTSLGRSERKVQASLDTVISVIHLLLGEKWESDSKPVLCFKEGRRRLEDNSELILGGQSDGRRARIMVTMPTEAADNPELIISLIRKGMNCVRINCAHDDVQVWGKIIHNVRNAEKITGTKCRIHMDLGGPKLRTSSIQNGPAVLKLRPGKNKLGEVFKDVRILLYEGGQPDPGDWDHALRISGEFLDKCRKGNTISFRDYRGKKRKFRILEADQSGSLSGLRKTTYLYKGMELILINKDGETEAKCIVEDIPAMEGVLLLRKGDALLLTKSNKVGSPAIYGENGVLIQEARIGCTIPEVLDEVKVGETIWFDDGKIGAQIERTDKEQVYLRITHAGLDGEKLRAEKGINLPDTDLHLAALTAEDLEDLNFSVEYADTIGLSFTNGPEDVRQLIGEIKNRGEKFPGIILKIETKRGFERLPKILLAAMEAPASGVMIARGDLAIECGFGRLAELQEEILWVCEAAHVPVIWATQVLEGMAKTGAPSRAEVTDAAMGSRAECIMLNKGPHIVEATQKLDEILKRMQDHQTKKRSTHRKLHMAAAFFKETPEIA